MFPVILLQTPRSHIGPCMQNDLGGRHDLVFSSQLHCTYLLHVSPFSMQLHSLHTRAARRSLLSRYTPAIAIGTTSIYLLLTRIQGRRQYTTSPVHQSSCTIPQAPSQQITSPTCDHMYSRCYRNLILAGRLSSPWKQACRQEISSKLQRRTLHPSSRKRIFTTPLA